MRRLVPLSALAGAGLAACGGGGGDPAPNELPAGVTQHSVTHYAATTPGSGTTAATQDLLTGGLGTTGLRAAAAPAYADPANPTALELRRNALHSNYRAILDPTDAGGYSRFYGPNVTADGTVTANEGLIPGREYIGSLDDGTGRKRVVMAVQIPDSFNPDRPCLVLGPSSGSRGVYGAIGTAGEWGLKRGCAVALTDAGKGVGLHDLGDDTVNRIDGTRATRTAAGALAQFAADISESARVAFNAVLPNRFAIKQVHSQQNPEKDWGSDTLAAARYALYAINDIHGTPERPVRVTPSSTLVIAGSASNGGAAVLRAAEEDTQGLIDGVVAAEPVTQMPTASGYGIAFNGALVSGHGRTLADMVTYGNLYQPCAQLAPAATLGAEVSLYNWMFATGMNVRAEARCTSLAAKGLVTGATTAERATDALSRLRAYGWTPEHDTMHNAYWGLGNGAILSAMYPVAYGRFRDRQRLQHQLRRGGRRGQPEGGDRGGKSLELRRRQRHRQRTARRRRVRRLPGRAEGVAVRRLAEHRHRRLRPGHRPVPARAGHRLRPGLRQPAHLQHHPHCRAKRRGARRHRGSDGEWRRARQAHPHRARPQRCARPGEQQFACVRGAEPGDRG
jgi:hydroxybutyrate-dimer hydrolase